MADAVFSIDLARVAEYDTAYPISAAVGGEQPMSFVVRTKKSLYKGWSLPLPEGKGYLTAFSNSCTHMGCQLVTKENGQALDREIHTPDSLPTLPCPCHGSKFDLAYKGVAILAPASQHLPALKLILSEDKSKVSVWEHISSEIEPRFEEWPSERVAGVTS